MDQIFVGPEKNENGNGVCFSSFSLIQERVASPPDLSLSPMFSLMLRRDAFQKVRIKDSPDCFIITTPTLIELVGIDGEKAMLGDVPTQAPGEGLGPPDTAVLSSHPLSLHTADDHS